MPVSSVQGELRLNWARALWAMLEGDWTGGWGCLALTSALEVGTGAGWGGGPGTRGWGGGAVPVAAVGHPPRPSSPRGDGGGGGEAGGPEAAPGALLYLQIVEDEEERLSRQALVELHGVRVWGWHLVVVGGRRAGVPGQVLPVGHKRVSSSAYQLLLSRGWAETHPLICPQPLHYQGRQNLASLLPTLHTSVGALGYLITPILNSTVLASCGEPQGSCPASFT